MSRGQRIVLVVASFFALSLAAQGFDASRTDAASDGGWFNYAPNSGFVYSPSDPLAWWEHALPYAVALGFWTALSLWLLRSQPEPNEG